MIKAIIFDWGGVMEAMVGEADTQAWEERLALEPGALADALWGDIWEELEVNAIGETQYLQRVAERLGFADVEALEAVLNELYAGDRLNREMVAAAKALRQRYQVAVLSNAWPGQRRHVLETFGIDLHTEFDVYVNSAEVELRKPDLAIYRLAVERLEIEPSEAVFLDDLPRNVAAAREIGLHAIHVNDPAEALNDLERLLGHPIDRHEREGRET